jgi:hypothetical protein
MRNTAIKSSLKSVFEMSAEELRERITPTAKKAIMDAWDKNSYITYFDEKLCPTKDVMVHEYRDRKELVQIAENGETRLIKIL